MKKSPLLICGLCLAFLCHSQAGLYITDASPIVISANTTVAIDGLVLTPTLRYSFNGVNSVVRKSSLTHPSITPAINRTFIWNTNTPAYTGSIGIYYEDAELNGLSETDLTLNLHDGTIWKAYNTGVSRNPATNLITTTVSGLPMNELALAPEAAPLPLKWERISASRSKEGTTIQWHTSFEVNTAYFIVERRVSGTSWERIDPAVSAMNTPGHNHYSFSDPTVSHQQTFYRVRQVDQDERYAYSSIVSVPALHQNMDLSFYPNPATQHLSLRSSAAPLQALHLFDATGKHIRTERIALSTHYILSVSSLPKGFYIVQVERKDTSLETLCFIKN